MDYSLNPIAPRPEQTLLTLEDAKRQLDVTFDDDNTLIQSQINEAISWVEGYTGRWLYPVNLELYTGNLTQPVVRLPGVPILSVTSVLVDGVAVAGFRTIPGSQYTVLPPAGQLWPYTVAGMGGTVITYLAGYPDGTCPPALISAVKAMLNILYDKPTGPELKAQMDGVERSLETWRVRNI